MVAVSVGNHHEINHIEQLVSVLRVEIDSECGGRGLHDVTHIVKQPNGNRTLLNLGCTHLLLHLIERLTQEVECTRLFEFGNLRRVLLGIEGIPLGVSEVVERSLSDIHSLHTRGSKVVTIGLVHHSLNGLAELLVRGLVHRFNDLCRGSHD